MKVKKLSVFILIIVFLTLCFMTTGFTFFKKNRNTESEKLLNTTDYSRTNDKVWCVTFQLVWNDFMDKFMDSKPVIFEGGNSLFVDELNKRLYDRNILSNDSYYITQGEISLKLKKQIEKDIYRKFKEKSDILNLIDWNAENSYLFYALLKKDFEFLTPFKILANTPFNNSSANVKYFGIDKNEDTLLRKQIDVLFYESPDEYAVKLQTKENEDVILYRTNKNDTFLSLYEYVVSNSNIEKMGSNDTIKIPEISINELINYNELCNKRIKGTNKKITAAMQTIKFNMNNKGGSLKSEAALGMMRMSMPSYKEHIRNYNFDKKFILFLKEKEKNKPYFAVKIDDISYLVKE